ncbi:hypothetical protein ACFE04_028759 [Oxalis oulophora]
MNGLVPVSNGAVTENGGGSGNIADRRAFNAIRINTNVNALTSMDDTWSQFITIPNGISPTELLTSPLLPNYQVSTRANSIVANFPPPVTNVPPTVPFPSGTSASPISSFDRNIELSSEHFQQTLSPQMSDEANFEPYMYQMDDNPFELNSSYTAAQQPLSVPDFSVSSSNVSVSGTNFDENENFTSQFQPTSSEQQSFEENVMNFWYD